jgi:glycosyltransferase involved in cell wall biosynthesis
LAALRRDDRILLLFLEPTPYILGLLHELHARSPWPIEAWFLGQNLSQNWSLGLPGYCRILDGGTRATGVAVWRALKGRSVRLLHLSGWGGHKTLLIALMLALLYRVPVAVESDTQSPFSEPLAKRMVKRALYRVLFRIPNVFLPGGTRQAVYLKSFGVSDQRIRVAQMTVDVEEIARFSEAFAPESRSAWRAQRGIAAAAMVFIFVGRLETHKGISRLLSAFGSLMTSDPTARLLMVGDGPLRDEVSRIAATCEWVVPCGRLHGAELLAAYCASDAFVLPSVFEPWGLVVNEAMACGLPVVISERVGCGDDLVKGKDTGIVYLHSEPDQLESALGAMSRQADMRVRMGHNARRLISGWTLREEARRVLSAWGMVT